MVHPGRDPLPFDRLGFMLTCSGATRALRSMPGLPVGRLTALALLLSGGFAGLAGANDVLGIQGLFKANWNPGYGFTAFALVYLARLNAVWLIPFAFFFSFLLIGGESMPRRADVPTYYIEMLEGLMLIFFAAVVYLERRSLSSRVIRRRNRVDRLPSPDLGEGSGVGAVADERHRPHRFHRRDAGDRSAARRTARAGRARRGGRGASRSAQPRHRGDDALRLLFRFLGGLSHRESDGRRGAAVAAGLILALHLRVPDDQSAGRSGAGRTGDHDFLGGLTGFLFRDLFGGQNVAAEVDPIADLDPAAARHPDHRQTVVRPAVDLLRRLGACRRFSPGC